MNSSKEVHIFSSAIGDSLVAQQGVRHGRIVVALLGEFSRTSSRVFTITDTNSKRWKSLLHNNSADFHRPLFFLA
ncbi:MAG: hypothetical protein MJE68_02265 [Proteobacteria bacterium]|nr:hypothetical protein [Pseudomonadota bacterium]